MKKKDDVAVNDFKLFFASPTKSTSDQSSQPIGVGASA